MRGQGFTDHFLTAIPANRVVGMLSGQNAVLRGELSVTAATTARVQAELPGVPGAEGGELK